jgi:hypothetical protein
LRAQASRPGIFGGKLAAVSFTAVRLTPERIVVPAECACCGALASRSVLEARFATKARVLVPYCGPCHVHASCGRTRALAAALSSALLALTLTAGLPLLWQPPSAVVYALLAACGASLPLAVARLRRYQPESGHTAAGGAAFWGPDGAFICRSDTWGTRLATASHVIAEATDAREPSAPAWAAAFPIAAAVASLFLFGAHFPRVRVLNLGAVRVTVAVDGRKIADVDPTSAESATAGLSLRLPAGEHLLTATGPDGQVVDRSTVVVESGAEHLYAPASVAYCFWVEETGYGRSRGGDGSGDPTLEVLPRTRTFWSLPHTIDFWFAPAPEPENDSRSTGGLSFAVRQARCDEAPDAVRSGERMR